jgi:hypothetical protein
MFCKNFDWAIIGGDTIVPNCEKVQNFKSEP